MEKTQSFDDDELLEFSNDPEVTEQFNEGEIKITAFEVLKWNNTWNKYKQWQRRIFIITDKCIYNFRESKVMRREIWIRQLKGITRHVENGMNEFVLHVTNEQDLFIKCKQTKNLMEILKLQYMTLRSENLPIYGAINVKELKNYVTDTCDNEKIKNVCFCNRMFQEDIKPKQNGQFAQTQPNSKRNSIISMEPQRKATMDNEIRPQLTQSEEESKGGDEDDLSDIGNSYVQSFMQKDDSSPYQLSDFKIIKLLGTGTFGKVYLVQDKRKNILYAMKSIRKDTVIKHESIESLEVEKMILLKVKHPFIISMDYVFVLETRVYFIMQYIKGGDMGMQLSEQIRIKESRVKFYIAQIVLALGYLHQCNIYYRDLKPENILLASDGYILLADFGLAKIISKDDKYEPNSFCGTPSYLSPEMILGEGHDHTIDWWALGILTYELLVGIPPFYDRNQQKMFNKIKNDKFLIPNSTTVVLSPDSLSFINQLLIKDRYKRLGAKGDASQVLSHPFLKDVVLKDINDKNVIPEFLPTIETNKDINLLNNPNFVDGEEEGEVQESLVPYHLKSLIQTKQNDFEKHGFKSTRKEKSFRDF